MILGLQALPCVATPVRGAFQEARQEEAPERAGSQKRRGLPAPEVGDHRDEIVNAALPKRLRRPVNARYRLADVRGGLRQDTLDAFSDRVEGLRHLVHLLRRGGLVLIDDAARRVLCLGGQSGGRRLRLFYDP